MNRVDWKYNAWELERLDILERFTCELAKATGDGSVKRQRGEKPPWWKDNSHFDAIGRHSDRYDEGERVDPDSGAHPMVHIAWRCLAIACQETGNIPHEQYCLPDSLRNKWQG